MNMTNQWIEGWKRQKKMESGGEIRRDIIYMYVCVCVCVCVLTVQQ